MSKLRALISYALAAMAGICFVSGVAVLNNKEK